MKRFSGVAIFVLYCCAIAVFAVNDPPKLTDLQKLRIREAQIEVQNIQLQMDTLQQQWTQLQQQKSSASQKLTESIKQGFDELKVKQEDYELGADLSLTLKAKPPQVPKPDVIPPAPTKGTK